MKKSFITFACLLFVSTLYSQVTLEDVSKGKQFIKENSIKDKPNSSNWISLSSGFSHFIYELYNYDYYYLPHIPPIDRSNFISELTYSHRHFLNSNNSLSYDGGIFFDYKKLDILLDSNSIFIPSRQWISEKQMNLSLCFRILYNYHFKRFSISTGFGTSFISFIRSEWYEPFDDIYYKGSIVQFYEEDFRNEFFGVFGLNVELNKNNELGIRTNYQLLNNWDFYRRGKRLIFQLKYNHRL